MMCARIAQTSVIIIRVNTVRQPRLALLIPATTPPFLLLCSILLSVSYSAPIVHYKMIDVSQWRASIGLWNYCQAASSRPAIINGRHSHSFKAAVDSKSGSTTSGEKTSKLPAALQSLVISLLLSLLRYMKLNFIPPTGKQTNNTIYQCTYNRYNDCYCYDLPPVISLAYSYYWQ